MVEISDIVDEDSLKAWLEALPQETEVDAARARAIAVTLAFRAAARAFPELLPAKFDASRERYWEWEVFTAYRCLLISAFAAFGPEENITSASAATFRASATAASHAANGAGIGAATDTDDLKLSGYASAAQAAASTARINVATATVGAVIPYAGAFADLASDVLALVDGNYLDTTELWLVSPPLPSVWMTRRKILLEASGDWIPVVAWYDHLLDPKGRALPVEMLREIIAVPEATWAAGPREALPVIREIWERYQLDAVIAENPLALRIERSATGGALVAFPIEERDMSLIVGDIRKAVTEFNRRCKSGSGNLGPMMQRLCEQTIKELRTRLGKVKRNPRELLRLLEETRRSLSKIAETEGFASDERLDRFIGNLEHREEDICVAAPEVMEEVKARLRVRVQRFSAEQMRAATRISVGMFGDSSGMLAAALARAVIIVNSDDVTEAERQGAWTFLAGALPRGARVMRVDGESGMDPSENASLLDEVVDGADKAWKLSKGWDAIQEAVADGQPWAAELWSQVQSGNWFGMGT